MQAQLLLTQHRFALTERISLRNSTICQSGHCQPLLTAASRPYFCSTANVKKDAGSTSRRSKGDHLGVIPGKVGLGLAVLGTSVHLLLAMNNLGDIWGAHRSHESAVVHAHLHLGADGHGGFGCVSTTVWSLVAPMNIIPEGNVRPLVSVSCCPTARIVRARRSSFRTNLSIPSSGAIEAGGIELGLSLVSITSAKRQRHRYEGQRSDALSLGQCPTGSPRPNGGY